jgi:DNA-binding transcriptional LysR family regulator
LDIRIFKEFITLVVHKNYTSAAQELHMSQPSLSRHIAQLERELDCKLFFDTQSMALTAEGDLVYKQAGEICNNYAALLAGLSDLPQETPERILIQDLLHLDALNKGVSEAIEATKERYPHVRFEYVQSGSGTNLTDMLERRRVDAVFRFSVATEPHIVPPAPEGILGIGIAHFHEELAFGVRKDSPLLENPELKLTDLASCTFRMPARRCYKSFHDDFIEICREAGFYPKMELVPTENILEFYGRDIGDKVNILTKMTGQGRCAFDPKIVENLVIISPTDKTYYLEATMLYLDKEHSETFNYFIEQVKLFEGNAEENAPETT